MCESNNEILDVGPVEFKNIIEHLYRCFSDRGGEIQSVYGGTDGNPTTLNHIFVIELRRIIAVSTIDKYIQSYTDFESSVRANMDKPTLPWMVSVKIEKDDEVNYIKPDAIRSYYDWASLSNWNASFGTPDMLLGCVLVETSSKESNEDTHNLHGVNLPENLWSIGEEKVLSTGQRPIFDQYSRAIRDNADKIIDMNDFDGISIVGFTKLKDLRSAKDEEYGKVYVLGDAQIQRVSQLQHPDAIEDLAFEESV